MDELKELPGIRFPSMTCRGVYRRDSVRKHFSDVRVSVFNKRPSFKGFAMSQKIGCLGITAWYQCPIGSACILKYGRNCLPGHVAIVLRPLAILQ
jgi:hypothetical protein